MEHRERLFAIVKENIIEFSENCYGCRVVQKAVEFTRNKPGEQAEVVALLEPYSLYLIENVNGNHVMQKCIEVISLGLLGKIIKVISDNVSQPSLSTRNCLSTLTAAESSRSTSKSSTRTSSTGKTSLTLWKAQNGRRRPESCWECESARRRCLTDCWR